MMRYGLSNKAVQFIFIITWQYLEKKRARFAKRKQRTRSRRERARKKLTAKREARRGRKKVVRRVRACSPRPRFPTIQKHEANPIIEPRPENFWEMKATFNPAAVNVDGRVHLLYRAIGGDDMSTLGLCRERRWHDGRRTSGCFGFRAPDEGTQPLTPFRRSSIFRAGDGPAAPKIRASPSCEEDNKIYLTYTAFDGWGSVRIALSSIAKDDFMNQRWRGAIRFFFRRPARSIRTGSSFPEKINGKYAVLHSISPRYPD